MDINFFNPKYHTEQPRNDASFGLSDDNRLAFTTTDESVTIAKVCNPHRVKIQFVPLDHNIIVKDTQGKDISMCDAMIYTPEKSPKKDIYFIEIKEQMANCCPRPSLNWAAQSKSFRRIIFSRISVIGLQLPRTRTIRISNIHTRNVVKHSAPNSASV